MTRRKWIYHEDGSSEEVEVNQMMPMRNSAYIISEERNYKPYKSMITGEMIEGKKQHREHLKKHNKMEIGNEKVEYKPAQDHSKVNEGLKRRLYEVADSRLR